MATNCLQVTENYNGIFNYYPYGTILWIKQKDGTCSQVKVVDIECEKYDSRKTYSYIIHTYKFPNGNIVKGTIETTPVGKLRANLEDAKTYSWDGYSYAAYYNLFFLTQKASIYALTANKYDITQENVGLWGTNGNYVGLFGYKLKEDGTALLGNWAESSLHFNISYGNNKDLVIAVEEFDNATFYPNREQALANYHPNIEYFTESEEEQEEETDNITISVHPDTLQLLDVAGKEYKIIK